MVLWQAGDKKAKVRFLSLKNFFLKKKLFSKSGKWQEAILWYQSSLLFCQNASDHHNSTTLYLKLSLCFYESQKYTEALETVCQAIALQTTSTHYLAHLLECFICIEMEEYEQGKSFSKK